jgi:hypothetical protein
VLPNLSEVLKLLGFTTPFVYAAAIFGLFNWLDKKASGAAKKAISDWIVRERPPTDNTPRWTIELFNWLYGERLFSARALLRTVLYSLGVQTLLLYDVIFDFVQILFEEKTWRTFLLPVIGANVISNYISLFVIRRCLRVGSNRPVTSLAFGGVFGMLVGGLLWISGVLVGGVIWFSSLPEEFKNIVMIDAELGEMLPFVVPDVLLNRLAIAPLSVHLWLPIMALSLVASKALVYVTQATQWAQWFLKQGRHHPFEALGYVAALIVFAVALVFSRLGSFL